MTRTLQSWVMGALIVFGLASTVALPANAQEQKLSMISVSSKSPAIPFDKNFYKFIVNWQGSDEKTVIVYKVVNLSGKAAVCGGFFEVGTNTTAVISRAYLKQARVKLGGRNVVNNLSFLTHLTKDKDPDTVQLRCRSGHLKWQPIFTEMAPEVRSNGNAIEY